VDGALVGQWRDAVKHVSMIMGATIWIIVFLIICILVAFYVREIGGANVPWWLAR